MKNPIELQELIQRKHAAIWVRYQKHFNCGYLPRIEFSSKKSKYLARSFNYYAKIEYNLAYLCFIPWEQTEETIAHELAHQIVHRCFSNAKQAHGPEFRMVMKTLGYSGETKAAGVSRNTVKHAKVVNCYLLDL